MTIRLAINGLGRVSSQFVRVVNAGGFSDLFEIAAIHDAAGPEAIVRALKHDSIYGPFPGQIELADNAMTIGDRSIALSATSDTKNVAWEKDDIHIVIVDGSSSSDRTSCEQHVKKGARKVLLPSISPTADINIGFGSNEEQYDADAHQIVASAAGASGAVAMMSKLLDSEYRLRCGSATIVAPASAGRTLLDHPATAPVLAGGGLNNLCAGPESRTEVYEQLVGKLSSRFRAVEVETPTAPVGMVSLGFSLEQKLSKDDLRAFIDGAASGDALAGLLGIEERVQASSELQRDPRTVVIDWSTVDLLYETFLQLTGWYDGEWAAACRLADLMTLICEEGVPGTA